MANRFSTDNVNSVQRTPLNGVERAHADFVAFLYANHGEIYEENVGVAESVFTLPREKLAYGLIALLALYLIIGSSAQFVCNLIGFAYPAYASVKAVRTRDTKDDTQWLIYWCVFAVFSLIDFFSSGIMQWFPFYWLFKMSFLIFLYLPQTMGAQYLFYHYVNPLVTMIDEIIAKRRK